MLRALENSRLSEAVIPASVMLGGLVSYAQDHGVDPAPWFNGMGLSSAQCQEGARVSFREAVRVIRRAMHSLPKGAVGLQLGSRNPLVTFGVLGFAAMSCRTLGEALELGVRHHQACGSLMDSVVEREHGSTALRVFERFPEPDLLPFLCEEVFASSLLMGRALLNDNFSPLRIELNYSPPPYAAAYRRLFNCAVHFDAGANRMVFDASLQDLPLATYSPTNLVAALSLCAQQIGEPASTSDIVTSVERLLDEQRRDRRSMAQIAQQLHLTERSLRRKLMDAGQSFSEIRDRVLERHARAMVRDTRLPLTAIAAELGFSDGREFRRAFRRWSGTAPRNARE